MLCAALASQATPPLPTTPATTQKMLAWGPSTTPGVKYRLYHSTNDLNWHTSYLVTGTNYTVTVTAGSTNWFTVKAVNADGIESDASNVYEQPIQPKPAPAGPLQSVPITTSVQATTATGEWVELKSYTNHVVLAPDAGRAFRSVVHIGRPVELVTLK